MTCLTSLLTTVLLLLHTPSVLGRNVPQPARQCVTGWTLFNQGCYIFVKDAQTWPEAQTSCEVLGGNLVRINGAAENDFLKDLLGKDGRGWIGVNDLEVEGHYMSIFSHRETSYVNFAEGEPTNSKGVEHCMEIFDSGEWNDVPCTYLRHFVCEA